MAAELLTDLSRATDSNSSPLSGAKWYFYAPGTLTPQSVFTTAALSVAHPNPVVADSSGLFAPIYLDASLQYRGVLKDALGTTIRDIDPINASAFSEVLASLSGSTGAAQVGVAGSGTVQDALDALSGSNPSIISATSYTLLTADKGKILYFTASSAVTVTVPSGLGANFFCSLAQGGTGQVTVSAGAGATVSNADSQYATQARYVRLTLWASASNALVLEGRTV